jgi:hypothetical protein
MKKSCCRTCICFKESTGMCRRFPSAVAKKPADWCYEYITNRQMKLK